MARKRSLDAEPEATQCTGKGVSKHSTKARPGLGGPGNPAPTSHRYSEEETRRQTAAVARVLEQGWNIRQVMNAASQIGITRTRARTLTLRIWEERRVADAQGREHARGTQIQIAYKELTRARTPDPVTGRVNHYAIRGYLELLGRLQGTFEPIEINVVDRVAQSLVPTISGLGGAQIDEFTRRAQERKILAALAVKMLEEKKDESAIVVDGEAAE